MEQKSKIKQDSKINSNKGITLISLVITIIVLLILSGITIATLTGENGIITKAQQAARETEIAQIIEKARLDIIEVQADNEGIITQDQLDEIYARYGTVSGEGADQIITTEKGYEIKTSDIWSSTVSGGGSGGIKVGEEAKEQGTIDGQPGTYQNPTVPKGYVPVNTDSAKWDAAEGPQYNNGLVISDAESNGNEWVWVPVADATVMYETAETPIAITGGSSLSVISGVTTSKYSKSEIVSGKTRVLPNDTSSYREPDVVVGYSGKSYDVEEANYTAAGFTSLNNMAQTMVDEYEDMIDSVTKYGGFYIGRYELTANGEKPGAVLTNTNWYNLYAKCKTLAKENSNTTTRMIWGNQWDVTCNWLAQSGYNITDSSSWGNYKTTDVKSSDGETIIKANGTSSKLDTGVTTFTMANNVYDLAGNFFEWTQEANGTDYRASRGGYYYRDGSSFPVTNRFNFSPTFSDDYYTTRPTLLLNP